jgi:hypothetical protein
MAYYSGQHGALYINDKQAAKVSSWSFSSNLSTLDTTTLGDTDRTLTAGIRSTTGSCRLFYYADGAENDASTLLRELVKARTNADDPGVAAETQEVKLRLTVNDGSVATKYIEGMVLLTSVAMEMSVGTVLSTEVAFEFVGAPTGLTL